MLIERAVSRGEGSILHHRPIKMAADDVLVYLHIPKTAGTSIISFLDTQFKPREIFPFHSVSDINYLPDPETYARRIRLIRGHFRFGPFDHIIYRYIHQNPIFFTFMRDPIERTISAYRHIWRHPENAMHERFKEQSVTLLQFVTSPEYGRRVINHQARQIAGAFASRTFQWATLERSKQDVLYRIASERLEQFVFVGLTEQLLQSVRILAWLFGWESPGEIPHLNAAPSPTNRDDLSSDELAAIEAVTEVDRRIYRMAKLRLAGAAQAFMSRSVPDTPVSIR